MGDLGTRLVDCLSYYGFYGTGRQEESKSLIFLQNLCLWTTCACESNNDCCIPCMCFHVITGRTGLFQAFRWAENGASEEQREKKKAGGNRKKKSSMSITQWRLYFHYKCIRPQLVDLQLNTFFFFILRLHNRRKFSHICFSHNSFLNNWECYILAP